MFHLVKDYTKIHEIQMFIFSDLTKVLCLIFFTTNVFFFQNSLKSCRKTLN